MVDVDVEVEAVEGLLDELEHALNPASIAIVAMEASRGRRTQRS